jgi:hypothetical protein
MLWTNDAEVSPIEGNDCFDLPALCHRDYHRIGSAKRQIGILLHQVSYSTYITGSEALQKYVIAGNEPPKKRGLAAQAEFSLQEIGNLGQDQLRDDKRARTGRENLYARVVIRVIGDRS